MRKGIYIQGFSHGKNPVPAGCVIGQQLMTGAIFGTDPATGTVAPVVEDECRLMFDNAGVGWPYVTAAVLTVLALVLVTSSGRS